ncbi:hypothetical protein [Lentibacillus cibarius]|uniref:Uncharacterized protein n=1 Tax=Lentibacillus cibarius TaxID=2583219 RepID=A0A5S3QIV7_9BACI|nr:hypothetical protein [Lentibacillus cibarius]TMN21860.1 hypothetical protein FFL34_06830 [Lentibacillus cibarius]
MVFRVIFESDSLSVVDYFQIVAAIGTVLAALAAMITTLQNRKANKELETERHMMVKPTFRIQSHFEQREERIIDINALNIGFNRVLNGINVSWAGPEKVKSSIKEQYESMESAMNHSLKIRLDFSECKEYEINGTLSITYTDILGKLYKESIPINIIYHFNNITEEYLPILQNQLVGKAFI